MRCRRLLGLAMAFGATSVAIGEAGAKPGRPRPEDSVPARQRERIAQATATLPAKSCAGVVVSEDTLVLTAAHCVPESARVLDVVLRSGRTISGELSFLDREQDLALLSLESRSFLKPLALSLRSIARDERVLFVGRIDRKLRPQVARVERRGRCPSLPGVPDAIFTTLSARPGDSGAPIVDESLEVVGVIHGGAACHIAAPTERLARELLGELAAADGSVLRLADQAIFPDAAVAGDAAAELAGREFALRPELLARRAGRGLLVARRGTSGERESEEERAAPHVATMDAACAAAQPR